MHLGTTGISTCHKLANNLIRLKIPTHFSNQCHPHRSQNTVTVIPINGGLIHEIVDSLSSGIESCPVISIGSSIQVLVSLRSGMIAATEMVTVSYHNIDKCLTYPKNNRLIIQIFPHAELRYKVLETNPNTI